MFNREVVTRAAGLTSYPDVGLYIDGDRAIAAVSHPVSAGPSLHLASLHASVLYMHADGSVSLGGTTDPHARAFENFVDRIGEGVAPLSGTESVPAADLVAMSLLCLLTEVASSIDLAPTDLAAAATYPAQWTAEQVFAVRSAMNAGGLGRVALVSESEAAAAWSRSMQATWQMSDPAIAAARGAAQLASEFPVDAVTEEFPVRASVRAEPVLTPVPTAGFSRRPVVLAAAFAAVLVVGAGIAAALAGSSGTTDIPKIESVQADASTSVGPTVPSLPIGFPTVVPVAEPIARSPLPDITPEPIVTPRDEPSTTEREPTEELVEPATRPVAEIPDRTQPATTPVQTPEPTIPITTPEPTETDDPVPPEPTDPLPTAPISNTES